MQETIPNFNEDGSIDDKQIRQEFFADKTVQGVIAKMDDRVKETGETLLSRGKVGRNDICPCGSGKKFKKCCIDKVR